MSPPSRRGEGGGGCRLTSGGGGDIRARQQKSGEGDATLDLLLKYSDATLTIYV
jgi:hypothetical protein